MMTSDSGVVESEETRKKFDKKKWRQQKYDHKFKVEQWTEQKKRILKTKLQRELKKSNQSTSAAPTHPTTEKLKRPSRLEMARQEFERKRREKEDDRRARLKRRQEITEALEKHRRRRMQNNKVLSKKTKRGQPLMRGRLELLFEKVKQQVGGN